MVSSPPPSLTSPPWSDRTKRTVVLIALGLTFLLALELLSAWIIVLIAVILSYLLNPVVNVIEQWVLFKLPFKGMRRGLAVLLTFILVMLLLAFIVILIVPPLANQTQEFLDELPDLVTSYEEQLEELLNRPITVGNRTIIPWEEITNVNDGDQTSSVQTFDLVNTVQDATTALLSPVVNVATVAVSFLFNILFMFVIMFYLMKDGSNFVHRIEHITPIEYQGDVRRMVYELGFIWNAYLRGQLLLGIIVGVETGLITAALGLPQPLVLGLLAGILEFIPNIGPILASIPAILFALISPSTTISGLDGLLFALVTAGAYVIIQQSEALFLVPRVMGQTLDLHPLAVLIGIISGAAVAGILGIVLAAPILATIRLFVLYIWGKLLDIDPFSEPSFIRVHATSREDILDSAHAPALSSPFFPEQSGEIIDE